MAAKILIHVGLLLCLSTQGAEINLNRQSVSQKASLSGINHKQASGAFSGIFSNAPAPAAIPEAVILSNNERWNHAVALVVIVGMFTVPLMIFRAVLSTLKKNVSPVLQPALRAVYREMMALCVIAMGAYMLLRNDNVADLYTLLFPSHPHARFVHTFEEVNLAVFGAAVTYFVLSVAAIASASRTMSQWRGHELRRRNMDAVQYGQFLERLEDLKLADFSCLDRAKKHRAAQDRAAAKYMVLRRDFVQRELTRARAMDQSFDFSSYLCAVYGQQLHQLLSMGVASWLCLALAAALLLPPVLLLPLEGRCVALALSGYIAFYLLTTVHKKISHINDSLIRNIRVNDRMEEEQSLIKTYTSSTRVESPFLESGVPFSGKPGAFVRSRDVQTEADALFWRGARGPAHLLSILRAYFVFSSLYIGTLLLIGARDFHRYGSPHTALLLCLAALLPALLLPVWVGRVVPMLSAVSSIEFRRDPSLVLSTLAQSRAVTARGVATAVLSMHAREYVKSREGHRVRMADVNQFAALDSAMLKAGFNATIALGEPAEVGAEQLRMLCSWLGIELSTKQLQLLVSSCPSGRVDFEEFQLLISSFASLSLHQEQLLELLRASVAPSGTITLPQLQRRLSRNFALTPEVASWLVSQFRCCVDSRQGPVGSITPRDTASLPLLAQQMHCSQMLLLGSVPLDDEEEAAAAAAQGVPAAAIA